MISQVKLFKMTFTHSIMLNTLYHPHLKLINPCTFTTKIFRYKKKGKTKLEYDISKYVSIIHTYVICCNGFSLFYGIKENNKSIVLYDSFVPHFNSFTVTLYTL